MATRSPDRTVVIDDLLKSSLFCTVQSTDPDDLYLATGFSLGRLEVGLQVRFIMSATNTGAMTLNVDGLGAISLRAGGNALGASDLQAGDVIFATYDGTNWVLALGGSRLFVTGAANAFLQITEEDADANHRFSATAGDLIFDVDVGSGTPNPDWRVRIQGSEYISMNKDGFAAIWPSNYVSSSLTVAAGAVTVPTGASLIRVSGEGGAADDLATINTNGTNALFTLVWANAGAITLKHGTGNVSLAGAGDLVLDSADKSITLWDDGGTIRQWGAAAV